MVITNAGGPSTSTTITVTAAPGSDDVAASNLLAHWTFDVNSTEAISGVSALTGGAYNVGTVSYASAGVIGNCATFTNGALVYPSINKLNLDTALQSYTVSMWVKLDTAGAGSHWKSLFQLNANAYTDLFGIVGIQALNQRSADTLALQITQTQIDGTGVHTGGFGCGGCFSSTSLTNPIIYKPSASNGWTLLTTTYNGNGNNQKLKVYANGVIVDSLTLSTVTKPETFRIRAGGGPGGASGETIPTSWADFVTIGTFNWKEFSVFSNSNG
ncbi:MAG: hypothetical protein HY305_00335, partial [Sphingobacteriales bacterium]|nr:hypothetical protein [Sphingobacteriales bacterium]